ncbi:hypothetical protein [Dyella flagellata]|uniref:Lipoprotein n=1 Tax=Dyella flagellata TaxID=1867833 RepID=A0ABQ5X8Z6_9GAMM|nr:hypothetical protein [Dyella flagellata]GLQ87714.1 hypothetical protein GCM10007898_12810 [Dyella flagellata]
MNRKTIALRLFFRMAVLSCGLAVRLAHAVAQCTVPEVQAELQRSYSGWQVVSLEDLRAEDRDLWIKQHGTDCPGIFKAKLKSKAYKSYAVTIFKRDHELQQALLILNDGQGIHSISILSGPQEVAYLSVVSKAPPGKYVDVTGKKIAVSLDSVLYEAIEAGSTLYYFRNGRFSSITVSE